MKRILTIYDIPAAEKEALLSKVAATAVLQDQAKRWMVEQRPNYDLVTSQLVVTEAGEGDPDAASRRLAMLADIPVLDENPDIDAVGT